MNMVETRTHRTRDEIEKDWSNQGFHIIFEEDDDQIWIDKEQNELIFADWVNAQVQVYKLERIDDLL